VPRTDATRLAEAPVDGSKARWRPGVGLEVSSADKRFALQFNLLGQLQMVVHHTAARPGMDGGPDVPAVSDLTFAFRRARLIFGGNLFAPTIKYKIQLTA